MQRLSRIIGFGYIAICLAALIGSAVGLPLGYAPLKLKLGPAGQPVVVTIWYGTEKEAWLKDAVARFEAINPMLGNRQ